MAQILLVDDDEPARLRLRGVLEKAGFAVEEAANGKVALQKIRNKPAELVITEIVLPEMEGLETILELGRSFPDVKIIAMTAGGRGAAQGYLESAKQFGALRGFLKPVDPEVMLSAVRQLLG